MVEKDEKTKKPEGETKDEAEEESVAVTVGHMNECKPLVLLQVNCRGICNEILEFWHLTYITLMM